jgi:hypothetical protein
MLQLTSQKKVFLNYFYQVERFCSYSFSVIIPIVFFIIFQVRRHVRPDPGLSRRQDRQDEGEFCAAIGGRLLRRERSDLHGPGGGRGPQDAQKSRQ